MAEEHIERNWPLIFAIIVAVPEAISLFAFFLHRSKVGAPVPAALQGIYDAKEYETSNNYTKAKYDLALVKNFVDIAATFGFWFLKGFPWLDGICVGFGLSSIPTGIIYMALYMIIFSVLDLPFDIYSTFKLEESFGFNKTTPVTFVKDKVKGIGLGALIGTPVLYAILWFFTEFHENGWLYVFLMVTAVQLVLLFLMPVLILPLFMEMIPLPEGTALVTDAIEKAGSNHFLSGRVFYATEQHNEKQSWMTKDRRFPGAKNGEKVSIYFTQNAENGGAASWVIAEGEPGTKDVAIYATMHSPDAPDVKSTWTLTASAKEALKSNDDVKDALLGDSLSMTRFDVGQLKTRLEALATRLGYIGASIFVIDGSSRSSHSNAFCMGFGKFRRICLYDTLLPLMTEDEIVAVLGHEIGHDRLFHVHTTLVVTIAYMAIQFYFLGQFIQSEIIAEAFFVPAPSVYLGLVLFFVVWNVVDFFFSLPMTVLSRHNEFAADRYSIDADLSHAVTLSNGLKKLMKNSKANLTPHSLYVFLTYSHPPLDIRMAAIQKYAEERKRK